MDIDLDNKGKNKATRNGSGNTRNHPNASRPWWFSQKKRDGEPGVKTVWEGYRKLLNHIEASELVDSMKSYV